METFWYLLTRIYWEKWSLKWREREREGRREGGGTEREGEREREQFFCECSVSLLFSEFGNSMMMW